MKLATTTSDFDLYTNDYLERLRLVSQAGFRYVDLSVYTFTSDDPLMLRDDWEQTADNMLAFAQNNGLQFVQCHAPNTNPLDPAQVQQAVNWTCRAIEVCGKLGIPNMVIHAGWDPEITKQQWFERNKAFFQTLFDTMEKYGVNVLHENSTSANMPWYYPKTGADMREFCDYVDHPLFHACWDTGHANIEGSQYDQILDIGKHLYAVHINDNRGGQDEHVIPYLGTLNMDEIMHALIDTGFRGPFTFECGSTIREPKCWFGDRHSFPKDTRLLIAPQHLQTELEKFMFAVGKHILTAYNLWED